MSGPAVPASDAAARPGAPARGAGLRHGLVYGGQIVANSLAGYLFARTLAYYLGAGAEKSAFDIAWSLPFLVLNLAGFSFMYGVAASAFASLGPGREAERQRLFSAVLGIMLLAGALLLAAGWLLAGPICRLLAPGLDPALQDTIAAMARVVLPLSLVLGVGVFTGGVAAACRLPLTAELCLLLLRLGFVVWAWAAGGFSLMAAAWALLLTGIGATAAQVLLFRVWSGLSFRPRLDLAAPGLSPLLRRAGGLLAAAALAQGAFAYMRRLGTLDGPGTVAALTYAGAVLNALDVLLGKTLSFMTGPSYVDRRQAGAGREARAILRRGLVGAVLLAAPCAILATVFMPRLIGLLFGTGAFGHQDALRVAELARPLIWTLPFSVTLWVVLVPLLARSAAWLGPAVYGSGYVLRLGIYYFCFPLWGAAALAWGWTISSAFSAGLGLLLVLGRGREAGA